MSKKIKSLVLVCIAVAGCSQASTQDEPYLIERAIGDWAGYRFGDGPMTILECHNPLPEAIRMTVACPSSDAWSKGVAYWETPEIPAHDVLAVLIQELDRDRNEPTCWVHEWSKLQ